MRAFQIIILLALLTGLTALAFESKSNPGKADTAAKRPLLVELFTSEGCSSCPPAEELLARLETDQPFESAELITLAFHVDYWDELGWKDKYASPLFTQRQRVYDRKFRTGKIYTPQMVVDGDIEFVGSREKDAKKAIRKSLRNKKANVDLSFDGKKLHISISDIPKQGGSTVYLAYAEDDLSSNIMRGENAGRNLKHVSVVRQLKGIGRITSNDSMYNESVVLVPEPDWNPENIKIIVFLQENSTRVVHGVSRKSFGAAMKGEDG